MQVLPTVRLIYSFARSGGTLVNRILGSDPAHVVLSEVNPAGDAVKDLADQAKHWFEMVAPGEEAPFRDLSYSEKITFLALRAETIKKHLFVRDWSTINFLNTGHPHHQYRSMLLEQEIYLNRGSLHISRVVIARRAASVYESIKRTFENLQNLTETDFLNSYTAFASQVALFPKIHLEQLQSNPTETVSTLLTTLQIDDASADSLLNRLADFKRCTGNNTLLSPQTSSNADVVQGPNGPTLKVPKENCEQFRAADALMGYE